MKYIKNYAYLLCIHKPNGRFSGKSDFFSSSLNVEQYETVCPKSVKVDHIFAIFQSRMLYLYT